MKALSTPKAIISRILSSILTVLLYLNSSTLSAQCIQTTPYSEAFSGTGGGWFPPTSFFNQGSINSCWERDSGFTWIKAPSVTGGSNSLTGPSGDHTSGGNGYLSADNNVYAFSDFEAKLITPLISLANDTAPQLSFWYHMYGSEINMLRIDVRENGVANWTPMDSIMGNSGGFVSQSSPWHEFLIPLDGFIDDTVQFRFTAFRQLSAQFNGANCRASLDDLSITEWDGSCRVPLDLRIASKGVANAVVEWRTLNPQSTYEVQYAQGNGVPSSGTTSITSGTTFNYTGLAANSTYTLRVRAICAPGDTSDWSSHITIQTDCGVFAAPWEEDFEGNSWTATTDWTEQGTLDACFSDSASAQHFWKVCSGPYNGDSGPNTDHTPSGSGKYLTINHSSTLNVSTFKPVLITPWIRLDSLTTPELSFWLHAYSNQKTIGDLSVLIETLNGTTTSVLDTSGNLQASQTSPWKEIIVPLDQFSSDTIRLKFRYTAGQTTRYQQLSIDDIKVDEAPTCPRPKFPKVLSTTTTGANLDWSTGGASYHQVRYQRVNASNWTIITTNSSDAVLSGLQPNKKYRWEVRDSCGANDKSIWVRGPSFYTACTVFTAPYSNNFTNNQWQGPSPFLPTGQIGNCFSRLETSGYYWSGARSGFDHVVFSGPNSDHTGGSSGYMFTRPETATSDTANIILPMIDLDTLLSPEFSFWWHMYGQAIDRLNVYARTPSGPEILLGSIVGSQTSSASGNWTKQTYSLNAFQGDTVIIRMEGRKGTGNIFTSFSAVIAIDDIEIDETSTCPAPVQLTASNVTSNTATITWQGTASNSILEYGPVGFTLGTGQTINPASSPTTLTGLTGNTTYAVFVRDSCTTSVLSSNVTINFTTVPCPAVTAAGNVSLNGTTATGVSTGSASDSILWIWGDGNSSTGDSATYTYPIPGVYNVQQVAYNYCGSTDTIATTLTVCGAVVSNFNTTPNGLTVSFNAGNSVGAGLTYNWAFGDGTTAQGSNPSHTYSSSGNYTVTLTVTDACGTSNSTSTTLTVCPNVSLGFSYTNSNTTFSFTATPSNLGNYQWDFGDGTSGVGLTTNHTYAAGGNYTVVLTAVDACGSLWSDTSVVSTCPPLVGNFTFNIASSGSNGMLVQFFATVSGASSLIWNWGDGTQSITPATSISHTYPTTSLNYVITLSLINTCGDTLDVVHTLNEVGVSEWQSHTTKLYPNPVQGDILTLEFTDPVDGSYEILSILGESLNQGPTSGGAIFSLNVGHLKAGYYVISIRDEDRFFQKSFVKVD
jgi:PKD repeat protein